MLRYHGLIAAVSAAALLTGTLTFSVCAGQGNSSSLGDKAQKGTFEASDEAGAAKNTDKAGNSEGDKAEIEWWICPAGAFSREEEVQKIVDLFETACPQVEVSFRILDEEEGENEIASSLGTEQAPDVVLASPESIVTKWAGDGLMTELSGLWDEEAQKEFISEARQACRDRRDVFYAVPLFRDVYSMAVNYDVFEEAGVLQYLNEEIHSWKDSGFIDTVLCLHDRLIEQGSKDGTAGKIYCLDQTGQRALMSFMTNFNQSALVDDMETSYTVSAKGIKDAFAVLRRLQGKGIEYDPSMDGNDENEAFLNGEVFMTFNWDARKQKEAEENGTSFRIFPMMYPNAKNLPVLTGRIGALGVTAGDSEEKIQAAKSFVHFLTSDKEAYELAVRMSGCFPARNEIDGSNMLNMYQGDETMTLFASFAAYLGDYYQTMPFFSLLEEKWPVMLQKIGRGESIGSLTSELDKMLDEKLEEEYGIKAAQMDEADDIVG